MKFRLSATVMVAFMWFMSCGQEDPSNPPVLSNVAINCGDAPNNSFVDVDVILEVLVDVSDLDRDLTSVRGSINGITMDKLTDNDADETFSWTPPSSVDPMICKGEIVVRLEATDRIGNTTKETEIIKK